MCLTFPPTALMPLQSGVGYKVFQKKGRFLHPEMFNVAKRLPTRKWLYAKDYRDRAVFDLYYPHDWHIFSTLGGAKNWLCFDNEGVIRKVKYRKAHTKGDQTEHICVVAEEIYIYPGEVR